MVPRLQSFWASGFDVTVGHDGKSGMTLADALRILLGEAPDPAIVARLQAIYDSEINFGLQADGDGFFAWVGDPANGIDARSPRIESLQWASTWLEVTAALMYPESAFAQGRR